MRVVKVRDRGLGFEGVELEIPEGAAVMHAAEGAFGNSCRIFFKGRVVEFHNGVQARCCKMGRPAPFPKGCRIRQRVVGAMWPNELKAAFRSIQKRSRLCITNT